MQLRDYQQRLVQQVYNKWLEGNQNVLAQLSTGGGKSVILSSIIANHDGYSIAIAHRNELIGQLSLTLARFGIRHNIIAPKNTIREIVAIHNIELQRGYYDPNAPCIVASVDTLIRLPLSTPWFSRITLCVIDEAHHCLTKNKWGRAVNLFPNAKGLFPTATPIRADGYGLGRHADGVVDCLVQGPTMRELIKAGHLTDYRIFAPPNDLDLSNVAITASGEYSHKFLSQSVHKSHITGDVVKHYLRIAPGKLGVTFAVDIKAAAQIAQEFRNHGVPAEVISSLTPPLLRQQLMRKFRNKEILQLVNVAILGEGVDVPAIEVVSMGSPTQSFVKFAQEFGRSLRPLPGKQHAIVIDHVSNVSRHGLPDAPRIWSLDRRERRTRTTPDDVIPLKTCLKCMSVYTRFARECPYCGYYSPPQERSAPSFVDGDLLELDDQTLARLRGEIIRSETLPKMPQGVAAYVHQGIKNRHRAKQDAQAILRETIATWAGYLRHQGRQDSEIYRQFYVTFGTDVLSAQALGTTDTNLLNSKLIDDISKMESYAI